MPPTQNGLNNGQISKKKFPTQMTNKSGQTTSDKTRIKKRKKKILCPRKIAYAIFNNENIETQ